MPALKLEGWTTFKVNIMRQCIIEGNINPDAQMRLFCIPYAGGGASIFHSWRNGRLREAQVCAIQMPGRESRISEIPFTDMTPLVEELGQAILPWLDMPFAFFGHSNGALVSFELVRLLRRRNLRLPLALIVAGHNAPDSPHLHPSIAQLPEKDFLKQLRELNGVPKDIERNAEIMELLLPTLRADINISETYRYVPEEPLDCPIMAVYGLHDPETDYESVLAWQRQTRKEFCTQDIPGDHFFLNSSRRILLGHLSLYLKNLLIEQRPAAVQTYSATATIF
jgi:medium-chain acyl-[acyl-carrier-protein] hydrolase